jgi:hypothetical protein
MVSGKKTALFEGGLFRLIYAYFSALCDQIIKTKKPNLLVEVGFGRRERGNATM